MTEEKKTSINLPLKKKKKVREKRGTKYVVECNEMPCVFECVHNSCETGMKLPNFDMLPNARIEHGNVFKKILHTCQRTNQSKSSTRMSVGRREEKEPCDNDEHSQWSIMMHNFS